MTNPDLFIDALRDKLRACDAVLDLVENNPEAIQAYEDDAAAMGEAVYEGGDKRILIGLTASDQGEAQASRFEYTATLFLRLSGGARLGTAFYTICTAIPPDAGGLRLIDCEIHPDFEQLGLPTMARELDEDGVEYMTMTMRFRDRTNG